MQDDIDPLDDQVTQPAQPLAGQPANPELGTGPAFGEQIPAETLGERTGSSNLDSGAPADFGEEAEDSDKSMLDKAKDKYHEIMDEK